MRNLHRGAFNRTSMELKPLIFAIISSTISLLIEPVWNWNSCCYLLARWSCYLLIEPVWNWNFSILAYELWSYPTFNRTSMELKPEKNSSMSIWIVSLLIEPVWNWNGWQSAIVLSSKSLTILKRTPECWELKGFRGKNRTDNYSPIASFRNRNFYSSIYCKLKFGQF